MTAPENLAAVVEAEEFSGGPMVAPPLVVKTGQVVVESKTNGDWRADCVRCGAGCGAAGANGSADEGDDCAYDYEAQMLEQFTAEHQDCSVVPDPGAFLFPSPATMPSATPRHPVTWVVKQASGGEVRVLAERHFTYVRPEGAELRFVDGDGPNQHKVATIRAGSWHWVVAESALNPKYAS